MVTFNLHILLKLTKQFHFHMKPFIYLFKNLTEKQNSATITKTTKMFRTIGQSYYYKVNQRMMVYPMLLFVLPPPPTHPLPPSKITRVPEGPW